MLNQQIPNAPVPPSYYPQRRRSRWWIPLIIVGVILVLFFTIIIAVLSSIGSFFEKEPIEIKSNSVLVINFNKTYPECIDDSFASLFSESSRTSFYDVLKAIERATTDEKIRGIYLRTSLSATMGFAKRLEIIEALDKFKKSGKFIYSFIEMGNENDYLLALPSDKIFLAREGVMEMNGFAISALFLKGLFEKIGIEYYVQQYEDFKSAGETFSRTKFSDSARLVLRTLLNQRYNFFLDYVERFRKIPKQDLEKILNRAVYSPDSLLALGFVDSLLNDNQAKDFIREVVLGKKANNDSSKKKVNFIAVSQYIESEDFAPEGKYDKENAIAIVYASGPIIQRSQDSPFQTETRITPNEFIKNLKKAREDKKVKAIIIRIDSPGGSVIASDEIWEEIRKTKKIKPVYASMSDVAASGGYYIAMACDTIIAHPATITGSIGVITMIPNLSKLIDKIGITIDTLSTNPSSQDLNFFVPFNKRQFQKLDEVVRPVYYRFVSKVAESRKKNFDEARALAKGRVWTGEQAFQHGLVDVLGGLDDAIKLASKRIGIPNPMIKRYPKPIDEFQILLRLLTRRDEDESKLARLYQLLNIKDSKHLKILLQTFPPVVKEQLVSYLQIVALSNEENVLAILPSIIWLH